VAENNSIARHLTFGTGRIGELKYSSGELCCRRVHSLVVLMIACTGLRNDEALFGERGMRLLTQQLP
jgi:hypothetical protein